MNHEHFTLQRPQGARGARRSFDDLRAPLVESLLYRRAPEHELNFVLRASQRHRGFPGHADARS